MALWVLGMPGATARASTWSTLRQQQASHIIGMKVENNDGSYLGKVKDLLVDLDQGEVAFVIISSGGWLTIGSQNKIAPAEAISMATAKKDVLSLPVRQVRWAEAPIFRNRDLTSYQSEAARQKLRAFYGVEGAPKPNRSSPASATLTPTGRTKNSARFVFASDLMGQPVLNLQQQTLGRVSDLLVDFYQHKSPLIVLTATGAKLKREGFAIPLNLIHENSTDQLTLTANKSAFENAPLLDQNAWTNSARGNARIYRFEPKPPDNTVRNVRDRDGGALTPLAQSEDSADLHITQKIRHALFRNRLLSFTAKNIKIITNKGMVVLRGPVKRDQERLEIVSSAAGIAGEKNVIDELEVLR
jgi:hyperosmotically inducible protein